MPRGSLHCSTEVWRNRKVGPSTTLGPSGSFAIRFNAVAAFTASSCGSHRSSETRTPSALRAAINSSEMWRCCLVKPR